MFASLSKELAQSAKLSVDNCFVTDYMPFAPETYVKVYLLGLSLAMTGGERDNAAEAVSQTLSLDQSIVTEAFRYWSQQGVVNVLSAAPLAVEYLPVGKNSAAVRKFSKTKYKDFNSQLHAMLPGRNILPNEYNEYYSVMEDAHIEPNAMLAIIAYCIRLKGEDISYAYILTVAKNLAHQGCLTFDRVTEKLSEFDLYDKELAPVIKALSLKRSAGVEDKRLFIKWTKTLEYPLETVVQVAKTVKKGGMDRLDALLTKYYENRLFTIDEINAFNKNRDRLFKLTKDVNRIIGVYYEQLDFIIETYVTKWLGWGFSEPTLLSLADYCFKRGIRTLEGMNDTVEKFYKQGLLTEESIGAFMNEAVKLDENVKAVLDAAGANRPVASRDRDAYRTWTFTWGFTDEVILYAAGLSKNSVNPVSYISGILGDWYNAGIKTVAAAKAQRPAAAPQKKPGTVEKTYTSEQLNALFDRLDYEDL
ncbi:MAG: DnaD domain protein [Clostridiales bacterium]|jgi:DnaD/phage-associated family protein|nr:DnaD domain protein [Clostridiales bacterium]